MAWNTSGTGSNATANPWWQPGQWTGPGGYDWGNTPYGTEAAEAAPAAAWMRYGSQMGAGGGESAFDQWFRQQLGNAMTGFEAATISNPLLDINTYFRSLGDLGQWLQMFNTRTTSQQRGEQFGNYAAPVRWIPR